MTKKKRRRSPNKGSFFFLLATKTPDLMKGVVCVNEQQLTILIDKLEEISKDLLDAVNEKSIKNKNLITYQANNELLLVIETLLNQQSKNRKES